MRLNDEKLSKWLAAKTLVVIEKLRADAELEQCAQVAATASAIGSIEFNIGIYLLFKRFSVCSADFSTDFGRRCRTCCARLYRERRCVCRRVLVDRTRRCARRSIQVENNKSVMYRFRKLMSCSNVGVAWNDRARNRHIRWPLRSEMPTIVADQLPQRSGTRETERKNKCSFLFLFLTNAIGTSESRCNCKSCRGNCEEDRIAWSSQFITK